MKSWHATNTKCLPKTQFTDRFMLHLILASFLVVNEPCTIVRATPEPLGHIEDICPYGRLITPMEQKGEWLKISHVDGNGWVLAKHLLEVEKMPTTNSWVGPKGAYFYHIDDTEFGPLLYLPFETAIEVIEELPDQHERWVKVRLQDGQTGYIQRIRLMKSRLKLSLWEMIPFSKTFLGLEYLYGGTTSHGYDCSGFVQMLYRQIGITLTRNTKDQINDPRFTAVDHKAAKAGDLVFFFNQSGKVTHVGMMLNAEEFIHAFPKGPACITVNRLDDERFSNGYYYSRLQVHAIILDKICKPASI